MSDELWDRLEPLLQQAVAGPGGAARDLVRAAHRIQWEYLPKDLGFGSGVTCWRRLRDWNEVGV